ncbi:unnamed protein product [Rotaria sp. Silwood2]|nr:unnamed protein product [Rotaria sp. Silwood2]CAF4117562.1 unnamed protein product [Rotaria sp. Silwood2]
MHSSISIWYFLIFTVICYKNIDYNIRGTTVNGWESINDLFRQNFVQERDLGASIAVYHQGKLVVDLWGGWFDQAQTKPYDNDTLQLVFSTSKGLVAVAVALCVQQGLLDYSALVTKYWLEYGQNGKENTTVADILSHRAGLPNAPPSFEEYLNWTGMIHTLEQQRPLWSPGTTHGYHGLTYGWLAGELVRRVDPKRRTLGQFIQDEIANRIKIEFFIGLPPQHKYRVSPLVHSVNPQEIVLNESESAAFNKYNEYDTHRAEIPAVNGITNARSVAKLYASLIGELENGKQRRLLNEEILKQATQSNTPENETDFVVHDATSFGMGFLLFDQISTSVPPGTFGHNGNDKNSISLLNELFSCILGLGGSIGT